MLVDTSVWVDFSRRGSHGAAAYMRDLLDSGEVATCGPIVAELLAGAGGEVEERIWETLSSLSWADLSSAGWRRAGALARQLRRSGQGLPLTDLAIAATAAEAGHSLWSFDTDFDRIAPAMDGLQLYEPT